jgi:hypothetical protein
MIFTDCPGFNCPGKGVFVGVGVGSVVGTGVDRVGVGVLSMPTWKTPPQAVKNSAVSTARRTHKDALAIGTFMEPPYSSRNAAFRTFYCSLHKSLN